jgi:hypothetical protein
VNDEKKLEIHTWKNDTFNISGFDLDLSILSKYSSDTVLNGMSCVFPL